MGETKKEGEIIRSLCLQRRDQGDEPLCSINKLNCQKHLVITKGNCYRSLPLDVEYFTHLKLDYLSALTSIFPKTTSLSLLEGKPVNPGLVK